MASNTDALLLRSVDYGEADRIVTLLTRSQGKGSFLARAARRSKKRFAGALQAFHLLRVELGPGKGELGSLEQAQVSRSFPAILGDLRRMGVGFVALELLRELTAEHAPDEALFDSALALLEALEAGAAEPEALLSCFGLHVLALLGFAPQLERCGVCGRTPGATQASAFDPADGQLVCQQCGGARFVLAGELRARMQRALGPDWIDAAAEPWTGPQRKLATAAVLAFAEHRIGKRLTATALLQPAADG